MSKGVFLEYVERVLCQEHLYMNLLSISVDFIPRRIVGIQVYRKTKKTDTFLVLLFSSPLLTRKLVPAEIKRVQHAQGP